MECSVNPRQTVRSNEQMMQSMKGATSKCRQPFVVIVVLIICSITGQHEQANEPASSAAHSHGV